MATVGQLTADKKALDPRTIVENEEAIGNITQAYVGLIIYNKENGKLYKVTEINSLSGKVVNSIVLPPNSIGAQPEINNSNKLSADNIADGTTNKVVTQAEKTSWNGKQGALTQEQLDNITKGGTALQPSSTSGLLKNDGTVDTETQSKAANAIQMPSGATSDKVLGYENGAVAWVTRPSNGQNGEQGPQGEAGHNPCLGRFNALPALADLQETARVGDYIYVDDKTDPQNVITTLYKYDATSQTGFDQGTLVDVSNLSFNSGQSVSDTKIKDENGEEVQGIADVFSAEAGKELNEKLYGEEYTDILPLFTERAGQIDDVSGYLSGTERGTLLELQLTEEFKETYSELFIKGTSVENKTTWICFTKSKLPNGETSAATMKSTYISFIMGKDVRLNIDKDVEKMCVIPPDANYLYVQKTFNTGSNNLPSKLLAKKRVNNSDIVRLTSFENEVVNNGEVRQKNYLGTRTSYIGYDGTPHENTGDSFALYLVQGYKSVRFIGRVMGSGQTRNSGFCFYDGSLNLIAGYRWDTNNNSVENTLKLYDVPVPENAVYFATCTKLGEVITQANFSMSKYAFTPNYSALTRRSVALESGWLSTLEWPAWNNDYPNNIFYKNIKPYSIGNLASFPEMIAKSVITWNYIEVSKSFEVTNKTDGMTVDLLQYDSGKNYIGTLYDVSGVAELDKRTAFVKLRGYIENSSSTVATESGSIDSSGQDATSTTRVRTSYIDIDDFDYLVIPDGKKVFVYCYDENQNYIQQVYSASLKDSIFPKDLIKFGSGGVKSNAQSTKFLGANSETIKYVRVTVGNIDNSVISDVTSVELVVCDDIYPQTLDFISTKGRDCVKHDAFDFTANICFPVIYEGTMYAGKVMIRVPHTMSENNPVKSVFFRTGSNGSQSMADNGWKFMNLTHEFNYLDLRMFFVKNEYALFDMYGQTSRHPDRDSFGTPIDFVTYKAGYDILCKILHLQKDNLYMMSKSLGGVIAANMLYHKELPIKAISMLAPAIHVPNSLFGYEKAEREQYVEDLGLEGDFSTFTNGTIRTLTYSSLTSEQKDAFRALCVANADKLAYYNPLWSHTNKLPSDIVNRNWSVENVYDDVIKYSDVPVFIEVAEDDAEVDKKVIADIVKMLQNGMCKVRIVWIASGQGGHHAVDSDPNAPTVTVVTRLGEQVTIPEAYNDSLLFFENGL